MVKVEETKYKEYLILGRGQWFWRSSDTSRCFHVLGEVREKSTIGLSLTTPGPQFLHFLERRILTINSSADERLYWLLGVPYNRLGRKRVVVDGEPYHIAFSADHSSSNPTEFWNFMNGFNRRLVQIEGEQLVARKSEEGKWSEWGLFPRELIWFYGVERLRIIEEGEEEDRKKLPMLLWE